MTQLDSRKQIDRRRRSKRIVPAMAGSIICAALVTLTSQSVLAQSLSTSTNAPIIGNVESMTLDTPGDKYSSGTITVGGQLIILPRNLLIDQPANRMTLNEFFDQAPGDCAGVASGLAAADTCLAAVVGVATIKANRIDDGRVIAGELFIERGQETLTGVVASINFDEGFLMVGPTMVRINDPSIVHTIQQGAGCTGSGPNCSPDIRFGLDPENYTIAFSTGFPACIPSTVGAVPGGVERGTGGNADGTGDVFCPQSNRNGLTVAPVGDGTNTSRYAPIRVGDHIAANGSFENIDGQPFFSAHTLGVHVGLTTQVGQPNYIIYDEVDWDTAGFQNQRIRTLFIGFGTSADDVELYSLNNQRAVDNAVEFILASTQGCDQAEGAGSCTAQGLNADQIFKIRYDIDFPQIAADGVIDTRRLQPCLHLFARIPFAFPPQNNANQIARMNPCTAIDDTTGAVRTLVPMTRELNGRTRARAQAYADNAPNTVRDIKGAENKWGEYLTPVGVGHPEFVEIDLNAIQTPFIFEGQTWNLDRRTGPGGCAEFNAGTTDPAANCNGGGGLVLNPFPASCLVVGGQVPNPPIPLAQFNDFITGPRIGAVLNPNQAAITALCPQGLFP